MSNPLNLDHEILETRFEGKLDPSRDAWYDGLVDRAVRKLLAVCPTLQARLDAGELDPDLVADKVADAVLRIVRNPAGYTNESQGNYSYGMNNRVASGDLWYPDSDLADLGCNTYVCRTTRVGLTPGWAP